MSDVRLTQQQAEKVVELLEGWSLILRSNFPQRLNDLLLERQDQTGVYEPLRYDIPLGPGYVADEADALAQALRAQLNPPS